MDTSMLRCRGTPFFLALGWLALGPSVTSGQDGTAVVGLVLDEEGLVPIPGALVAVEADGLAVRTDEEGRFALDGVRPGMLDVRVEAPGYASIVEPLDVAAGEVSLVHFHLRPVAALLEGLTVGARSAADRSRGHTEHGIVPGERMDRTAADMLLSRVPGLSARRADGAMGTGVSVHFRGVSSFVLHSQPHIYMDGVRIDGGGAGGAIQVLDQIPASAVRRIRVLRGPASATLYPTAAAGVILIETMDP